MQNASWFQDFRTHWDMDGGIIVTPHSENITLVMTSGLPWVPKSHHFHWTSWGHFRKRNVHSSGGRDKYIFWFHLNTAMNHTHDVCQSRTIFLTSSNIAANLAQKKSNKGITLNLAILKTAVIRKESVSVLWASLSMGRAPQAFNYSEFWWVLKRDITHSQRLLNVQPS